MLPPMLYILLRVYLAAPALVVRAMRAETARQGGPRAEAAREEP